MCVCVCTLIHMRVGVKVDSCWYDGVVLFVTAARSKGDSGLSRCTTAEFIPQIFSEPLAVREQLSSRQRRRGALCRCMVPRVPVFSARMSGIPRCSRGKISQETSNRGSLSRPREFFIVRGAVRFVAEREQTQRVQLDLILTLFPSPAILRYAKLSGDVLKQFAYRLSDSRKMIS